MSRRLLQLRPGLHAHASGGLWIESGRALVVADVHLGFGWAQRRRGQLGPVADDKTATKLFHTVEELGAETVVFAGDAVHAPRPGGGERRFIEDTLGQLAARYRIHLVTGNHDRGFTRDFSSLGFELEDEWRGEGLTVVHGHERAPQDHGASTLVFGHFHPATVLIDAAGASRRVPIFAVAEKLIILPAFSPFARGVGLGIGVPEGWEHLSTGPVSAIAATGRAAVPLGPLRSIYRV